MIRKLATLAVLFLTFLTATQAQQKKRVAVMNFDYATVQSDVQAIFNSNQDIGKGIADLLVDKLVNDGVYSVIERKEIDKIIKEQNFSNSDRADPSSAAKIARILGVDAMIIGSITQFGRDDKSVGVGGGALGNVTGRFGIGGVKKSEANAVVQITGRMIDTSTAEILASFTAKGTSTRKGASLVGGGGSVYGPEAGAGIDMRSSNFGQTIIGEATTKCVADLSKGLEAKAATLPTAVIEIDGLVADAESDGTVIINVGSKNGLKKGDILSVKQKGKEIHDPATGKVLRSLDKNIGTLTIVEVEGDSATGTFNGAVKPKVGDVVTNKQ
jgi:curli biogenesis system outer membrane secretion channel CsgG